MYMVPCVQQLQNNTPQLSSAAHHYSTAKRFNYHNSPDVDKLLNSRGLLGCLLMQSPARSIQQLLHTPAS
jgi:hypothetical protein